MDMRTEASRYPAEAIPRTTEKKDSFRSNNENHRGKKRKKHKKPAKQDTNGALVDLVA